MEKYLHKMQPRSWEEKQFVDSNDTQAKEKSQCANSKILFGGRITLIIAEIQSLLKFIRTNYFKNFICQ